MNNKNKAYNILYKIDFNKYDLGKLPDTMQDNNSSVEKYWSFRNPTPASTDWMEIKNKNGINIINIKNSLGQFSDDGKAIPQINSSFKDASLQVEVCLSVPSFKEQNVFFSLNYFRIDIKKNSLNISYSTKSITCSYNFDENVTYNIVITKKYNTFVFMVNGLTVGKVTSDVFNSSLSNVINSSTTRIVFGGSTYMASYDQDYIGEMSNIQVSYGNSNYLKYQNSFTKYGDNLISRYNFNNGAVSDSNNIYCDFESVDNTDFKWDIDGDLVSAQTDYYPNNNVFKSSLNENFTISFDTKNSNAVDNISLIDLGSYKVLYSYKVSSSGGNVIINPNTTSALDFENGYTDKVKNVTWQVDGTGAITSNSLYGENSFETLSLGDGIYSYNSLLSGGVTPFTVEFHALIKSKSGSFVPLFYKTANQGSGEQGFHIGGDNNLNYHIYKDNNWQGAYSLLKANLFEKNKYTISYDGAALRAFINDKFAFSFGTDVGIETFLHQEPYRFFRCLIPTYSSYQQNALGIIDNINFFDNECRLVRTPNEYDEFLVCDLEFEGQNNSTKVIDNGSHKAEWITNSEAKISTNEKFEGISSLYLSANDVQTYVSTNNFPPVSTYSKFTLQFDFKLNNLTNTHILMGNIVESPVSVITVIAFAPEVGKLIVIPQGQNQIIIEKIIDVNVKYNFCMTFDNGLYSFYINGEFISSFNIPDIFYLEYGTTSIGSFSLSVQSNVYLLNGYFKNLKVYKDICIVPESRQNKIRLDFNENITDYYNNSNWTMNSSSNFEYSADAIEGKSLVFKNANSKITTDSSLDFTNNDFVLSMDICPNDISNQDKIALSNNTAFNTNNALYVRSGQYISFDYFNKPIYPHVAKIYTSVNNYYNLKVVRISKTLFVYIDEILVSIQNLDNNHVFNFSNGGNLTLGKSDLLNIGDSFIGKIDNFKLYKTTSNVDINLPVVHLPLENSLDNIGAITNKDLTISASSGISFQTIAGKKCFVATGYSQGVFSYQTSNVFNFGASEFHMSIDVYISSSQSYEWCGILSNRSSSGSLAFSIFHTYTPKNITVQLRENGTGNLQSITVDNVPTDKWVRLSFIGTKTEYILKVDQAESRATKNFDITITNSYYMNFASLNGSSDYSLRGYLSDFVLFVGRSSIPESYNKLEVINTDFSPTYKGYLFNDKFGKNIIHTNDIATRNYKNGKYSCSFNGSSQYLNLNNNDRFNFDISDFIIELKFNYKEKSSLHTLLSGGGTGSVNYIAITSQSNSSEYNNNAIHVKSNNTVIFNTDIDSILPDTDNVIILTRKDGVFYLYINDVLVAENSTAKTTVYNLNTSYVTYIGRNPISTTENFKGDIYSIKSYRNTSDLALLNSVSPDERVDETYTLSSETSSEVIIIDESQIDSNKNVKLINDTDKITLFVNESSVELDKISSVSGVELFKNYTGGIKDLRVYNTAIYDHDEFLGSELIDTPLPDIEVIDEVVDIQTINIGDYTIKGFIEGGKDRKFIIYNTYYNVKVYEGIGEYEYHGVDERFIDEYEIHELESGAVYPVNKNVMIKGYISGAVSLNKCGTVEADLVVECYRSDTMRLIGVYPVSSTGTYKISNLDVNSRYDIIFRDKTRNIKDQISNYRKPIKG